jgi:hypothetical protein
MKRREVERHVQEAIQGLLDDKLSINHTFRYLTDYANERNYTKLELKAVEKDAPERSSPQSIMVLRLIFLHDCNEIQIPNIFMPDCMKRERLGKRAIKAIHDAGATFGYELFVVDMVQSFYERLIVRGAVRAGHESVQITANTDLEGDVGSRRHEIDEEAKGFDIFSFIRESKT